ncbi:MAG: type II toxin-antitoxin system Phd/YefM family antitoxin, partial [Alphaproteobacteria bacterium]
MIMISSSELQKHLGLYQDKALREPIAVTRNGRERIVILSVEEYQRLKKQDTRALPVEMLSDDDLKAIEASEVPDEYAHLDEKFM